MKDKPLIWRDTREQKGWELEGYPVEDKGLSVGDYQIANSDLLVIERKGTVSEFWKDLVMNRKKFFQKTENMCIFQRSAIICEFSYGDLATKPPFFKKNISPFYVMKLVWELYIKYNVPTFCFDNKELAQSFVKSLIKRASEQL